jgi:hypothetical protein
MRFMTILAAAALAASAHAQTSADDPTIQCLGALATHPDVAPLADKLGSLTAANKQTIAQLADSSKPTESEKAMISAWGTQRMACMEQGTRFRAQYAPPGMGAAFEDNQRRIISLLAKLYSGELTYGQFNQARNESSAYFFAQVRQISQQLDSQQRAERDRLDAQRQYEAQRQQAEAQAQFQSGLQLLQMARPQPMQMPNLLQPSVNCISRPLPGNGVRTTCN